MKTSLHKISTKDNLELHGLLYEPDRKTKTVVAHVHGMAGNCYENSFLDHIAKTLTKNSVAFCPFNNRGCGNITTLIRKNKNTITYPMIGSAYEKAEDCVIDIKAQIDFLAKKGFTDIHLSGHSLGAPKAGYYLSKTQDRRVKSLIFLAPADMVGLVSDNKKRYQQDIAEAEKMVRNKRGDKLMSKNVWDEYPISANTYLNLFSENSKFKIFNFSNPKFGFEIIAQITQPIFTAMGKKDDVLVVPILDIMNIIKKEAKSAKRVEYKIIGNATHDYRGFERQLASSILNWVKDN